MIKYFCDRCGKEAKKLVSVRIPTNKLRDGSCGTKPIDLCEECENEANHIFDTLMEFRLYMFSRYLKKEGKVE